MTYHGLATTRSAWFGSIGGLVVHLLSRRRDRANKRKDQRVAYLIEAYRRLEECSQQFGAADKGKLESAVADIQLFWHTSSGRFSSAVRFDFAAKRGASLDELLADLRTDLRAELHLEVVPENIVHLRITYDKDDRT